MAANERRTLRNQWALRVKCVPVAPHQQGPHELYSQQSRWLTPQVATADEQSHELVQQRRAAGHAIDQVDAALSCEAHTVGHHHAEELLLAWLGEVVEHGRGDRFEEFPWVARRGLVKERFELLCAMLFGRVQNAGEEGVFAGEVVVDGALAHADRTGNVPKARAVEAMLGK